MKILITGAMGTIGKEILHQCLQRPEITEVVALTRREMPGEVTKSPKVRTVIVKDFASWDAELIDQIKGAHAMIWYTTWNINTLITG